MSETTHTDDENNELGLEDKIFDILNNPDKYDIDEIKSIVDSKGQYTPGKMYTIKMDYNLDCIYHNPLYFILCTATYIACLTGLILVLPTTRVKRLICISYRTNCQINKQSYNL